MRWGLFIITIGMLIVGISPTAGEGMPMWSTLASGMIITIFGIVQSVIISKKEKRKKREEKLEEEESIFKLVQNEKKQNTRKNKGAK